MRCVTSERLTRFEWAAGRSSSWECYAFDIYVLLSCMHKGQYHPVFLQNTQVQRLQLWIAGKRKQHDIGDIVSLRIEGSFICSYGRVCRRKFRAHLLEACHRSGVQFLAGEVENISYREGASASDVTLTSGAKLQTKWFPLLRLPLLRISIIDSLLVYSVVVYIYLHRLLLRQDLLI